MPVLDIFAGEIQHFEGYYAGSRSFRNNNPGNIRPGSLNLGQVGVDSGGFAIFPSYAAGYGALINDINAKFTGNTRTGLGPNSTVLQFFQVYAPSSDNNNPQQYAQAVVDGINSYYGSGASVYSTLGAIAALDSGGQVNSQPVVYVDTSGNAFVAPDPVTDNSAILPDSQPGSDNDTMAAIFF